jgi:hypothetical protein
MVSDYLAYHQSACQPQGPIQLPQRRLIRVQPGGTEDLKELGKDRLRGWNIVGDREKVVPERLKVQNKMKEEERKGLTASGHENSGRRPR